MRKSTQDTIDRLFVDNETERDAIVKNMKESIDILRHNALECKRIMDEDARTLDRLDMKVETNAVVVHKANKQMDSLLTNASWVTWVYFIGLIVVTIVWIMMIVWMRVTPRILR